MKRKSTFFLLIISLVLIFIFNRQLFFILQQFQLKIMKQLVFSIKKHDIFFWSLLIFTYGLIHSIGPGHGKTFLLTMNMKHKKTTLIFYSALIAYSQGIISFMIIYLIWKQTKNFNVIYMKYLDDFGKHIYGITLVLIAIFNILNEFTERKIKDKIFVIGVFFPCSGVLSLLLALTILGHQEYLLPGALIMSTGMFCTLGLFSILIDKIQVDRKHEDKINKILFSYYICILLIGIYVISR